MTARKPLLDALVAMLTPRDVLVSCLGANARYLPHMTVPCPVFALCDSMSAAIPLALGMALERPDRHVVALEGDGSLLMSPNVLATVAAAAPPNLTMVLWVNGRYESSGGQALPAVTVDWAALAPRRRHRPRGLRRRRRGVARGLHARAGGGQARAGRGGDRLRSGRGDPAVLRAARRDPRPLPPLATSPVTPPKDP